MKTKIVYALISSEEDIFLEQTICSIISLRYYTKNAYVCLVCDESTYNSFSNNRKRIFEYTNEIVKIETPLDYTKAQKSRYLKTSLRKYIKGDFLFIDSDTIITEDISSVDDCKFDLYAVPDKHVKLAQHSDKKFIIESAGKVNWLIDENDIYYYNSGVMLVKDTQMTKIFYEKWHNKWITTTVSTFHPDQPALNCINKEMGYPICEMDGKWNCQISDNGLKYLANAKIIHYFNSTIKLDRGSFLYYFMDPAIMFKVKQNDEIPQEIHENIKRPKECINENVAVLTGRKKDFIQNELIQYMFKLYITNNILFRGFCSLFNILSNMKKKL